MSNPQAGRLDAIEARLKAATPGPWSHFVFDEPSRTVQHPHGFICTTNQANDEANAVFIAHAPEDIAALLAEVRALRMALREIWDSVPASYDDNDPMVRRHAKALNAIPDVLGVAPERDL